MKIEDLLKRYRLTEDILVKLYGPEGLVHEHPEMSFANVEGTVLGRIAEMGGFSEEILQIGPIEDIDGFLDEMIQNCYAGPWVRHNLEYLEGLGISIGELI